MNKLGVIYFSEKDQDIHTVQNSINLMELITNEDQVKNGECCSFFSEKLESNIIDNQDDDVSV